jgi:hypothetical protein
MAIEILTGQIVIAVIILVISIISYLSWRENKARTEKRLSFFEQKKQRARLTYGEKYKCGYCSMYQKDTDCPIGETDFNSEPCEVFEIADLPKQVSIFAENWV